MTATKQTADTSEIESTLRAAGPFAYGSEQDIARIAREWADEGMNTDVIAAWLQAGCFEATSARQLRDAGISPTQASAPHIVGGEPTGYSIGYAFANSDIGLAAAVRLAGADA